MDNIFLIFFLIVGNIIQLYFFITMFLYLFISVIGVFYYRKVYPIGDVNTDIRFAILIPAHNEEKVIGNLLESIKMINWPKENYDVYVICDHCNDGTKEICVTYDVKIIEYNDNNSSSKAKALNRATDDILKNSNYDAFCYFDADSLVHPEFLRSMAFYLKQGYKVIQGQQLPKNPDESFISLIVSSGQFVTNNFFQKPKNILNLSATLHGKGMCFDIDIVKKFRWDEECLTEDLEMQMRIILNGIRIYWGENAIVYDEQPLKIREYIARSIRWTCGSLDTAKKHLKNLFVSFFRTLDFKMIEAFIYCFGVYRVILIFFASVSMYITRYEFNLLIHLFHLIPYEKIVSKVIFMIVPFVLMPLMMLIDKKINIFIFLGYFLQPFLGFFRIPIFVFGTLKDRNNWDRTEHESKITISDALKKYRRYYEYLS